MTTTTEIPTNTDKVTSATLFFDTQGRQGELHHVRRGGKVTACGLRWVPGSPVATTDRTKVTCDECWSILRDGDGCGPIDIPHDHLDNPRPWWADR